MKSFFTSHKNALSVVIAVILMGGGFTYSLLQTSLFPEITFPKIKNESISNSWLRKCWRPSRSRLRVTGEVLLSDRQRESLGSLRDEECQPEDLHGLQWTKHQHLNLNSIMMIINFLRNITQYAFNWVNFTVIICWCCLQGGGVQHSARAPSSFHIPSWILSDEPMPTVFMIK